MLPHQTAAVDRFLNDPAGGAILADPVGLGKTIEVGEIIRALRSGGSWSRMLILTKASQMMRWEVELKDKFDLSFKVYGLDFNIRAVDKWRGQELVIASMDLVKRSGGHVSDRELRTHYGRFAAAPEWDLVVVDEAHHLTPPDTAEDSLLFTLITALRKRTRTMLLLTGTPHLGDLKRFRKLLKLARPDLAKQIDAPETFDSAVADIIIRTRKDDITDAAGNFLLKGVETHLIPLTANAAYIDVEWDLDDYVGRWPTDDELDRDRSRTGLPIYRKLLASSVLALQHALQMRHDALEPTLSPMARTGRVPRTAVEAEMARLRTLLQLCRVAEASDPKCRLLHILHDEFVRLGRRKLLIFTEFRETQRWIMRELGRLGATVAYIHGQQSEDQKRDAINLFQNEADILVSTEAGAEGFNLQSECHIVVNFDLPWNPMHLEQRVGRVYRIGQTQRTIVVNAMVDTPYNQYVLGRSRQRADTIAAELRHLGIEFDDGYANRLFGAVSGTCAIGSLLRSASGHLELRDATRIDIALQRARSL